MTDPQANPQLNRAPASPMGRLMLNIRGFIVPVMVVVTCMVTTTSAAAEKSTTIIGASSSCAEWQRNRIEDADPKGLRRNLVSLNGTTQWVLGFLSGMAVSHPDKEARDMLRGLDGGTANLWLDKWCKENPPKGVANAATVLFDELLKQQKGAARKGKRR